MSGPISEHRRETKRKTSTARKRLPVRKRMMLNVNLLFLLLSGHAAAPCVHIVFIYIYIRSMHILFLVIGLVKFDTQEAERLLSVCESFKKDAGKRFPDRSCLTTVVDMNGKIVFITRFIRPLSPPQELLDAFPNNPQEATVSSANTR